jgi:hypothetical protein
MVTLLLDGNIYDEMLLEPDVKEGLSLLIGQGEVLLIKTHVEPDELNAIGNTEKRTALLELVARDRGVAVKPQASVRSSDSLQVARPDWRGK